MDIQLLEVAEDNNNHLKKLFHLYVAEMQQYLDKDELNHKPVDAGEVLNRYWSNSPCWPYLIIAENMIVGFCLIWAYPNELDTIDIDQYFVVNEFRRQGLGAKSLKQLLALHPGNWLIRVLKVNKGLWAFGSGPCMRVSAPITRQSMLAIACIIFDLGQVLPHDKFRPYRLCWVLSWGL